MLLDKATRDAISGAIAKGMVQRMEIYEEVWLSADQLVATFPMFSKDWLKRYGTAKGLPRERLEVYDVVEGKVIGSRYMYPKHRIQRWIAEHGNKEMSK